jgi:uncharacterized protein
VKVKGTHNVPGTQDQVFDLLLNPVTLAACMPGCNELVRIQDGVYQMKMIVAVAALTGEFSGGVRITDVVRPETFVMTVDGAGRIGHLKGRGTIRLDPAGDITTVNYEGDVQVGGTIAAVGQRLIDATSKMIIRNFFGNLSKQAQAAST